MDARIDSAAAFSIPLGVAHVIRNASASIVEVLCSLVISEQLLGTNEILVIEHTGCKILTFTDADADRLVKKRLGKKALQKTKDAFKGE
ncbi:hypothetical protein B7463_g7374, partial [Scytalidium lignicola]